MNLSEHCAGKLEAFEELDRQWNEHNQGSTPIGFWPQAIFYSIGFILTLGWTSVELWTSKCGTPMAGHFSICHLFGLVAFGAFLWAGFSRHNRSAAMRFLVSGTVPVVFPFLVWWLF